MTLTSESRIRDRARGCLLAGAIGDAMGGPFEGRSGPLSFREHSDWRISDETQLTLATCESIIELGKVSRQNTSPGASFSGSEIDGLAELVRAR